MKKEELFSVKIDKPDKAVYKKARENWDLISKPIDGLGDFEDLVSRIAAMKGSADYSLIERYLIVFCADNAIVEEGVSQCGQEITRQVAVALSKNESSSNTLAKSVNAKVVAVDVGINSKDKIEGIIDRKVAFESKNFLKEPSMSADEVIAAINTGIEMVAGLKAKSADIILTGEMGIGNTTTSTAVLCSLLNLDVDLITGKGAGLNDEGLLRKKKVIREGVEKYRSDLESISDLKERSFATLRCLGGLDIAALCGVFIGGAIYKIPVVIDGLISAVSALLAEYMVSGSKDYMIASHEGREHGVKEVLGLLGKKAYIKGNMALGEGTGALMLLPLIDSSLYFYKNALRFENAGIENYERFN